LGKSQTKQNFLSGLGEQLVLDHRTKYLMGHSSGGHVVVAYLRVFYLFIYSSTTMTFWRQMMQRRHLKSSSYFSNTATMCRVRYKQQLSCLAPNDTTMTFEIVFDFKKHSSDVKGQI
jgi:hypothetical protein